MLCSSKSIMEGYSGTLCSSTATEVSQTYSAQGWCSDWEKQNIWCPGGLFWFSLTATLSHGALFKTSKGWIIGFSWQVTFLTLPINPEEKKGLPISCGKKHQVFKDWVPSPSTPASDYCDAYVDTLLMHHKWAHYQVFHPSGSSVWEMEVLDIHKYGTDAQYNQI